MADIQVLSEIRVHHNLRWMTKRMMSLSWSASAEVERMIALSVAPRAEESKEWRS